MKREFLMLANKFDENKHNPVGMYASEKLDGCRCYYDGGITRGLLVNDVPWANVEKSRRPLRSTGLWSRYGKTIQAPDWFLDKLPLRPMDGELWSGRGKFQETISIVKQLCPDERWVKISFKVFDVPSYHQVFCTGEIKNSNYKKAFRDIMPWIYKRTDKYLHESKYFYEVVNELNHEQVKINTKEHFLAEIERISRLGGEGIMLRDPLSCWTPARCHFLLKCKPHIDDEAIVIGYVWGKETELGSKLLGKMGSLIVSWQGKQFKLSGFTDEERQMPSPTLGMLHQGEIATVASEIFPLGSKVTFSYRELTDDGIPKEARYLRTKNDDY